MVRVLQRALTTILEKALKEAMMPLAPFLRRLASGAALVVLSMLGFALTLLYLTVSFFCAVADLPYAIAFLWTALASGLVSAVVLAIGVSMIRKPR